MRSTLENVSCEGMPCLSFRKPLRNLILARPKAAISQRCCATAEHREERDDQHLSERVARVLGSGIGNAVERRQEQPHCRTPSASGVLSRIHDSPICKRDPLRSYAIPLRREERLAAVVLEEPHHAVLALQSRHIDIEVHPVDAFDRGRLELSPIFGDGLTGQAAMADRGAAVFATTSMPSENFTPRINFGKRA